MTDAFDLFKLLISAEDDISNDRYEEAGAFFRDFKRVKKIWRLQS